MQGPKYKQIDALRFFAILPVLFVHWHVVDLPLSVDFALGSNGVNLFFVISGFLITLGLIRSKQQDQPIQKSMWRFYVRRFLRIFPLYYLMLALLWIFCYDKTDNCFPWYLTYSSNFYSIKFLRWCPLSHLWSLAVEEQFYLVWPFVVLFASDAALPFLITATITVSLFTKLYWSWHGASFWTIYMNPVAVLDLFGLGGMLAYFYHFHRDRLRQLLFHRFLICAVLFQLVLFYFFKDDDRFKYPSAIFDRFSFGLVCAWLIGRAVFGFEGVMGHILNARPLRYIGKISYGIYLIHNIVPHVLSSITFPNHIVQCIVYFLFTVAVSSFSWYFFESRILRLKDRFA